MFLKEHRYKLKQLYSDDELSNFGAKLNNSDKGKEQLKNGFF